MEQFWSFFSFPLNLLLAALWTIGWLWLMQNRRDCSAVRFMLSPAATVSALIILLCSCLWIGFSGDRDFVQSVFFVILLLYVQTVVFLITLRGIKTPAGKIRWRFIFIHVGFLLALGAGFWGSPDSTESRVALSQDESTRMAYNLDGKTIALPYELCLKDFKSEFEKGHPVHYEAVVSVNGNKNVTITVNHPYEVRFGEHIYLTNVSDRGCILQIVREPWRYFSLIGIIMLIAGAFMLFVKGPKRQ